MKAGAHRYAVGERFTALVIVALEAGGRCRVRCDCGVEKSIWRGNLRATGTSARSCGCLRSAALGAANKSHGHTTHAGHRSPEYLSWDSMVMRCTNPSAKSYPEYGGRGIAVCDRWRAFSNFLADMGPRPAGTTLDRVDGSKGYAPGNCRWATTTEQAGNRQTNHNFTLNGQTKTITEWARQVGISDSSMLHRLRSWGLSQRLLQPATPARLRHKGTRFVDDLTR